VYYLPLAKIQKCIQQWDFKTSDTALL